MSDTPTPETDTAWDGYTTPPYPLCSQDLAELCRKLERERDEWKAKFLQQNKDLGCELRDPNGTIWDHAKTLQRERDEAREKLKWRMHWVETLRRVGRKLKKERDEAREETIRTREFMGRGFAKAKEELATMETRHAATMMHTQSVVDDANQLREQRDRLAEALERILEYQGRFAEEDPESIATEALQSLTPNEL